MPSAPGAAAGVSVASTGCARLSAGASASLVPSAPGAAPGISAASGRTSVSAAPSGCSAFAASAGASASVDLLDRDRAALPPRVRVRLGLSSVPGASSELACAGSAPAVSVSVSLAALSPLSPLSPVSPLSWP